MLGRPMSVVVYMWVVMILDLLTFGIVLYARVFWSTDRLSTNMWTAMVTFYGALLTTIVCLVGLLLNTSRVNSHGAWYFLLFHPFVIGVVYALLPRAIR
jgi:hypothetical protein